MKVETIMTKEPVCCSPSDTMQAVAQLMRQHDVGAIPVVSDFVSKRLVGIITDRDLCIAGMANGKDPRTTKIESHFTANVVSCFSEDPLEVCEQKMKQNRIRRIPVVDKQNRCIGIIVQADLARMEQPISFQSLVAEISKPNIKRPATVAVA
jgi:CBS domain-containing protein